MIITKTYKQTIQDAAANATATEFYVATQPKSFYKGICSGFIKSIEANIEELPDSFEADWELMNEEEYNAAFDNSCVAFDEIYKKGSKVLVVVLGQEWYEHDYPIIAAAYAYDVYCAGEQCATDYEIKPTDVYIAEGVELVEVAFRHNGEPWGYTRAIVYDTGDVFVLYDWDGSYPETRSEIEDFEWLHTQSGRRAIMWDGLPKVII